MQLLGKLLGDPNKRDLKVIQPLIDKINAFEPAMQKLSDDELAAKTAEFRSQLFLHLKGGMVLEDELVKLFREALTAIEPYAKKSTNERLHAAISEYRQALERRRAPEQHLRDHLQDTLSECFETGYELLSPALNSLRATAAMDRAEETQKWPDEAKDPQRATLSLLKEIEPALKEIDDDELSEAFQAAWPHVEEARRNAPNKEEGADDRLERLLGEILRQLQPEIAAIKAEAMDKLVPEMVKRYRTGKTLEDVLPEAFAAVREAGWRRIKMRHYDVQLIGGVVLHQGKISEMKTGEGKTLVATLPVYLNALTGKGVHVVTVNDYLAKRDAEWMGEIYKFLGLTVGVIVHGLDDEQRKQAYDCDVSYGTNKELGFDYLRDNMKYRMEDMVQRGHIYAIVDEVDSILIDEARTPLIISGRLDDRSDFYNTMDTFIPKLDKADYEVDEKQRTVSMTEAGMEKMERALRAAGQVKSDSLYDVENVSVVHHVNQALRAHKLFQRDKDYIVRNGEVVIIDEFTGRMMPGRRYSEGLHQALEGKERQPIQPENQTLASITFQNYFRMYEKLAGMTGTAMTEADEFIDIYNLEVIEVPTNMPMVRLDDDDEVYRTGAEKYRSVLALINECKERGQPVLVGTTSIEKSEQLAEMLRKQGWEAHDFSDPNAFSALYSGDDGATKAKVFAILNARYHEQEAYIIAQAGVPGAITIATNMAGRGTDIPLGGNAEMRMRQELHDVEDAGEREGRIAEIKDQVARLKEKALAAGGRYVRGTERQ